MVKMKEVECWAAELVMKEKELELGGGRRRYQDKVLGASSFK